MIKNGLLWVTFACAALIAPNIANARSPHVVQDATVTLLSTNIATVGQSEWGFAALIEVDGRCILFDTGHHPDTVIKNAKTLGKDLSCVTDIVLSHFHGDHTGGLATLLGWFHENEGLSFPRLHVARGIFEPRVLQQGQNWNPMFDARTDIEHKGVQIIVHETPTEIIPGIWVSGNVERHHPERNYSARSRLLSNGVEAEDTVPDSQALSILTKDGHIILTGCGHAGIANIVRHMRKHVSAVSVSSLIGGFHIQRASTDVLNWTADALRKEQVLTLMGAHCSGTDSVLHLRRAGGYTPTEVVIAGVGATFSSKGGIGADGLVAR